MPAVPGQRAAQRPQRAAVAAQRALGRAATGSGGLATVQVIHLHGRLWHVEHDQEGRQWWTCQQSGARYEGGPRTDERSA
ncbi:hypothetical protein ACFV5N_00940 [Streptomyces sp. NPDC059853]|uniref:hypothetical protein n=1 Tax=Streptomyces TaxID=1883 RepID=UPI00365D4405